MLLILAEQAITYVGRKDRSRQTNLCCSGNRGLHAVVVNGQAITFGLNINVRATIFIWGVPQLNNLFISDFHFSILLIESFVQFSNKSNNEQ